MNTHFPTLDQFFAGNYERNFYAAEVPLSLSLCGAEVECESIWQDETGDYYLHVTSPEFEGDIKICSLSTENLIKINSCLEKIMTRADESANNNTVAIRIKFSADLTIEANNLKEAKEKWQNLPLFTQEAMNSGAQIQEILLIEDAENYDDLSHEFERA